MDTENKGFPEPRDGSGHGLQTHDVGKKIGQTDRGEPAARVRPEDCLQKSILGY